MVEDDIEAPPTKVLVEMSPCSSPKMRVKPPALLFGGDSVGVNAKDVEGPLAKVLAEAMLR